jgi:hypothetical protein
MRERKATVKNGCYESLKTVVSSDGMTNCVVILVERIRLLFILINNDKFVNAMFMALL